MLIFSTFLLFSQENCTNGIDDDGDGLIDLNDPDCICQEIINGEVQPPNSFIPNQSFEELNCCPFTEGQLSCSQSWVQASDATSDFFHTCGFIMPGFQNSGFLPFPDGNGATGFGVLNGYTEYIGACLSETIYANQSYTIQFQLGSLWLSMMGDAVNTNQTISDLEFTIFGASNCGNLPFSGIGCPPGDVFSVLGSTMVAFGTEYQTVTITFVPTADINEIILGSSCNIPLNYPNISDSDIAPYFVIDNIVLNESINFETAFIERIGNLCTDDLRLFATPFESEGTFQWFENGVAIPGQINDTLFVSQLGLVSGLYQLMYTIDSECYVDTFIVDPISPINLVAYDGNICLGGTLPLNVSGANNYNWAPDTFLNATTGSTVYSTPEYDISYTVIGTDINGCSDSILVNVSVEPLQISVNSAIVCTDTDTVILIATGAENYSWSPSTGLSSTTGSQVSATVSTTMVYTVIGEINGCVGESQSIVSYNDNLDFSVNFSPNPAFTTSPQVFFNAYSSDDFMYHWQFNDQTFSDTNNFFYNFPEVDSIYSVLTIATSANGCIDSTWSTISIISSSEIFFDTPNIFTPNGDGSNDLFTLNAQNVLTQELLITNRWGNVVYESSELNATWNGLVNNSGHECVTGIYFYKYVLIGENGQRIEGHGRVHLVR